MTHRLQNQAKEPQVKINSVGPTYTYVRLERTEPHKLLTPAVVVVSSV